MTDIAQLADRRRTNLQAWMDKRKLNQTSLASLLGVGRAYVSLLLQTDRAFGEKSARSIEEKLRMPRYFLDSDGQDPEVLDKWDSPTDLEPGLFGLVPWRELTLSPETHEAQIQVRGLPDVALSRESMLEMKITKRDQLVFAYVRGDSLSPYLRSGDVAMVDMAQNQIVEDITYAIKYGEELRFRRLAWRYNGCLLLRSIHPHQIDEIISAQDTHLIQVIGRVVARWGVL